MLPLSLLNKHDTFCLFSLIVFWQGEPEYSDP